MLTVLMATHNGGQTLPRVLDAYSKLDTPPGGWKLVIVNNGSTDDTGEIIASFATRLPLTCIWEPSPGKNNALNTGLSSVGGDLVVMTDDDAIPNHDWLVQYRQAADAQPSFSVFGGSIVPLWEGTPQSWILPYCHTLSITDPSWEEGPIVASRIYGPNMAVRYELIEVGHRFDTSLGPRGMRYQMGDEADFLQKIAKAGFTAWHCKRAVVGHIIRKHQMNKRWMLRRARASGRAMYRWEYFQYNQHLEPPPALLLGTPRYVIREVVEQAFRVVKTKLIQHSDIVFQEKWKLHYLIGRAMGGRVLHHGQLDSSTGGKSSVSDPVPHKAR